MVVRIKKEVSFLQMTEGIPASREAILKEEPVRIPETEKNKIIEELRKVTSSERVRDELYVRGYYRGGAFTIGGRILSHRVPDIVVYPESREEVQGILKIASKYSVPVTIVGTQNLILGNRPLKGGIVVDVMGMKQIHKVDTEHGYVVVEPGVTVEQLMERIRPKGYMVARGTYPPSMSVLSTLTTMMTMHNMGNRMWDQVIGVEMVMPDGTILYSGTMVDASTELWTEVQISYPGLINLFRPHYATLGVITKAAIRIWPLLEKTALPVFGFDNFESAFKWSHAIAKSSMVDQTMVWNWATVGHYNYGWSDRYLDFMEARMKYDQDEAPKELNLFNCFAWAQMRGYKEEVEGAVEAAKRLSRQYGGKYQPEKELQEKLPGVWTVWQDIHKEFWPEWWGGPEPRRGPQLRPGPEIIGRHSDWPNAVSISWTGPVGEIIKMYGGLKKKWKEAGYKNWRYYTRMFHSGHTPWFRCFPHMDSATQEDWQESNRIRNEITNYVLEKYRVNMLRTEFAFNDPENPENVTGRAKPIRRIMSAVQREFDPEKIMNPVHKKYTLL